MENKELLAVLNDLYEKEQSLRNLKKETDSQGRTLISGPDLFKNEYDIVVCFLLFLYYKRIIFIQESWCVDDIERCINISDHPKKQILLGIWSVYKCQYPYLEKYAELLAQYDFSKFVSDDDEESLINWANNKFLFKFSDLMIMDGLNDTVTFEVVSRCQKQLGIEFERGNILVNVNDPDTIKKIVSTPCKECKYTLYGIEGDVKTVVAIYIAIFKRFSHISLLEKESEASIIPSEGNYDGVIIQTRKEKVTFGKTKVLDIIKDGGFALVLRYDNKTSLNTEFFEYEVPLMFDNHESNAILIRKVKDDSTVVRYGSFYANNVYGECAYWSDKMSECIKNCISTSFYQELKKEDFVNTRCVQFKDVKRLPDQLNFVWKKKEDIFAITEDLEEWLDNSNVDDDKIIDADKLSNNPFKIAAGSQFYLHNFVNKEGEDLHLLNECEIKRAGSYEYTYSIPGKYAGMFKHLYDYDGKIESEEEKRFDKYFCCRIIKSPCLLYHEGQGILRVNASEKSPVCMKKYFFFFNEEYGDIEGQASCDVITINPEYDENFIIYQLLNQKDPLNSKYILVAPSKEEQHTYFLNKRLDYLSKFQPIVAEMEDEVSKTISESPAYITGVGFNNFRRFASLPLMPLHGVNILVGGNNAGKSTFVKGMLLAIDNIKSYILDNNDNSLFSTKFHFDTRSYHDVRVGTFDRSYSYNAIPWKDDPNRRNMSFVLSCAHFVIELDIEPTDNMTDQTAVPVSSILVHDSKRNAEFYFDFKNMITAATFDIEGERVKYQYSGFTFSRIKLGANLIPVMIRSIIPSGNTVLLQDKELTEKLKAKAGFILEIADELERVIENINIEYIYAHGVTQKVLFNINDKNDYMAQTLHDFIVEKTGDVEDEFIKKCLNEFGLGTDYDVHSIGGEAYIIQIKNKNGRMVYLADLGMGTNQLVILIFRLAIIIHKQRMRGATPYKPTIIIEEPEQNMHPAFQSKLATLFYEVNRDYGFSFIVETHSEYLVRKSQVIVAQQKYTNEEELKDKNPFIVYYFPSEGTPYEMGYRMNGRFVNKFKKGFYDEADTLALELL